MLSTRLWHPAHPDGPLSRLGFALIAAALFLVACALHELGHAAAARALGLTVRRIDLSAFGGASQLEGPALDPRGRFLHAAAGPTASFAAMALCRTVELLGQGELHAWLFAALHVFGFFNFLIATLSLLPAWPLDGAALLDAMVERRGEGAPKKLIAHTGFGVGAVLVGFGGLWIALGGLGGIWLASLGLYLRRVASSRKVKGP